MGNLVILGNFDGVHLAHKYLIEKAIEYAKENNLKTIVYTFKTLKKDKEYILSLDKRKEAIKALGVDKIVFDDFERVKKLSPVEFVESILKKELNVEVAFCGYNYTFGYMKEGNAKILQKLIKTIVVDEFRLDDKLVSSSKIRELLYEGNIEKACRLLGRKLEYEGIVVKGRQLGRLIGFPTANIKLDDNRIKLPNGVYGTVTKIEGDSREYLSVTNIGNNPTIAENNNLSIETFIYNFSEDIYGKRICVKILKMIRKEKKFNTIDELKNQIKLDSDKWEEEYVRYKDK
ncbi:bifunctional riboflavin kinase/FAD synthetase [Oceanivirga miroungae]|uniref:Riboflavin biosynthesis protein n=1 Tax=Oceanivirga miroungae TaxID=1130046 RepID=A0A6I8MB28_9FUSO|nr:bifunctional riboflavin kinase/FAD synthetase [Oceanivirga miroungae]VWL85469.1 riboflavin biosynthesis protein RibF [Oceanivirga miroungae]